MGNKRNALVDITRVAAAAGIILSHVDLTGHGAVGVLFGQFLSVRFSLMFFLAIIGYYVEKAYQAGQMPIIRRVSSFVRIYGAWSLVYLALSFVMLVIVQKVPLGQFLVSKLKSFFFSGSYYHFWFYPAVIYTLFIIGGMKKLLGNRAVPFLIPLAAVLYAVGLLGTGYLPIGQQIPWLRSLYAAEAFDAVMHLFFLGFPSIVFGMAAAQKDRSCSGFLLLIAAAVYAAESVILCLLLGWREDPQMLASTPVLTVLFLYWVRSSRLSAAKVNHSLFRVVSAGMYNVHPLFLAVFAVILPELDGLGAFVLCVLCSAVFGWVLYCLRKVRLFALFI